MANEKSKKSKGKIVLRIIIIFILLNIIALFAISKIIYDSAFPRYQSELKAIPNELIGMETNIESVSFQSKKNTLQGYLYSDASREGLNTQREEMGLLEHKNMEEPMPGTESSLIVIVPGIHSSIVDYIWQSESFLEYGWDVFIFSPTGNCESEGKSEIGFSQELYDLDAALTYIEENYDYENIFLFGHSRGAYSACGVLESEHDISAVVAVSGLNSAMEATMEPAVNMMGNFAYSNYPTLWLYQVALFDAKTVNLSAAEEIANSKIPTMIVQGTDDETARMDEYSIYCHKDEMTAGNVEYYICDEPGKNGHTNLMFDEDGSANDDLMEAINTFYYNVLTQR